MGELSAIPQFEYEDVITTERQPEYLNATEDQVMQVADLVREDLVDFWDGTVETYGKKDKIKMVQMMNQGAQSTIDYLQEESSCELTDQEKDIVESAWQIGQMFSRVTDRRELEDQMKKAKMNSDQAEMKKIALIVDQLNIDSARWQNQVVKTMFNLEKLAEGREFLDFYWQKFDEMGELLLSNDPEEFKALKNGILGLKAAIELFERCGWEAYLAHPEQDAIEKIDLWVKNGNRIKAVQVKSVQDSYVLRSYAVDQYGYTDGLDKKDAREVRQQNQLLTAAQNYGKIWRAKGQNCDVSAYWLSLPSAGSYYTQDRNTGRLNLPADFVTTKFAQDLAEDGGEHE